MVAQRSSTSRHTQPTRKKMSAVSVIPITVTAFSIHQPNKTRKFQKPIKICAKRLNFSGEFGCGKSVCLVRRIRNPNTMTSSNGVRDEGIRAFEFDQEALMEEPPGSVAGGLEAALNNLSKWIVAALFAAIILWRHDAEALWATSGAVLNSLLSIRLKKILNQERPISTLRSDPGMPSSHAQSIFYSVTFVILSMLEWYGMTALTTVLSGLFLTVGSYFSWLRVSQKLHTLSQVLVGAAVGSIFSIMWFWSWNNFISDYFMSHLWVRIVVIMGAIGFCLGFLHHVFRSWIVDER